MVNDHVDHHSPRPDLNRPGSYRTLFRKLGGLKATTKTCYSVLALACSVAVVGQQQCALLLLRTAVVRFCTCFKALLKIYKNVWTSYENKILLHDSEMIEILKNHKFLFGGIIISDKLQFFISSTIT